MDSPIPSDERIYYLGLERHPRRSTTADLKIFAFPHVSTDPYLTSVKSQIRTASSGGYQLDLGASLFGLVNYRYQRLRVYRAYFTIGADACLLFTKEERNLNK